MTKVDPPLRNCVKKINDAWLHATNMKPKEICLSPIPAGEFISFYQNAELIFSNLSAAAAFLVTFCAAAKSYKDFNLTYAYLPDN
jgi:hypothetical protein